MSASYQSISQLSGSGEGVARACYDHCTSAVEAIIMRLVVGFAVLLATSCSGSPARPAGPIDTNVTIALGQRAVIAPTAASVRFDSIIEDSRCPADVYCVWAGRAGAKLAVVIDASEQPFELHSDPEATRAQSVGDLRFEWIQLDPYPMVSRPTQPGDYRLTIRVVR
jgi:hypothetical protein